jgi:hypothetical protein
MARGDPQINIRLQSRRYAALEAAAFLNGETVQELVRTVVEAEADRHSKSDRVGALLAARAEHQAEQSGKLSQLDPKKRSPRSS